jgi:GH25 family lysozyme M1 (1,4-beta-N-acetylmuramidase)
VTLLTGYFDVSVVENGRKVAVPRDKTAAAGSLDEPSAEVAFGADAVWLRVYENKGRPDPERYAEAGVVFATAHRRPGQRVALIGGNEPNNAFEGWGGTAADYRAWFRRWSAKVTSLDDSIECWWAGMSPSFPGWLDWYAGVEDADGAVLHAYGLTVDELMAVPRAFVEAAGDAVAWIIGEVNHGVGTGRVCDRDIWAASVLMPVLTECQRLGAEAFLYFVYDGWTQDDGSVGQATPPIARGTRIDAALRAWRDPTPEVRPVLRLVDVSNNQGYIDFDQLAAGVLEDDQEAGPIAAVISKASGDETSRHRYIDEDFPFNWRETRRIGRARGGYHYAKPSLVAPGASIETFGLALEAAGGFLPYDLAALDMEDPDVPVGVDLSVWCAEWGDLFERIFGFQAGLYTGDYYMDEHNLHVEEMRRRFRFLWLASYQPRRPPTPPAWPRIAIWQNGVWRGGVPGIAGPCDTNVFEGTLDELRALGRPPRPDDPPAAAPGAPVDPRVDALNNLWNLTLQTTPQSEERRRSAQEAINVVKKALEVA